MNLLVGQSDPEYFKANEKRSDLNVHYRRNETNKIQWMLGVLTKEKSPYKFFIFPFCFLDLVQGSFYKLGVQIPKVLGELVLCKVGYS